MKKILPSLTYKQQKVAIAVLFLFFPLLLLLVFTFIPAGNMIGYSFTDWNGYSPVKNFVGLENYKMIFSEDEYFKPLFVSLYYLAATFIQIGLALLLAVLLSGKVFAKNLFKGIYFFPALVNSVAIGFVFLMFFQPAGGLDSFLNFIGLGSLSQYWIKNPDIINISLAYTSIWRNMGYNIVLFVAAISSISANLFEAADIDGANRWQQFRYIILPGIKAILGLNLFLAINGALSVFEIPYIMTQGGNGSMTFVIQTVNVAFKNKRVGLASAMAVILLVLVITISLLQKVIFRKRGENNVR